MAVLDTRPQSVDLYHYAGDTLTVQIRAPSSLVAGKTWTAQVRSTRQATVVDATFAITVPTVTDGPAYLVMTSVDTARLPAELGTPIRVIKGTGAEATAVMIQTYQGVWDCQVRATSGTDPVTTLVSGAIKIEADV